MNRTGMMIGVLVLLVGIAVYVWSTSEGTQVDPKFAELKQAYACPHCNAVFELTGGEAASQIESYGGITCTSCDKKIDDFVSARTSNNLLGGGLGSGDNPDGDSYEEEDAPPKPTGVRKRSGD